MLCILLAYTIEEATQMKPKKENVKVVQKFRGYFLEDCECQYCNIIKGASAAVSWKNAAVTTTNLMR
jgi:hypothetical protein